MPKVDVEHLTVQQQKWFASLRDGLQRETGKSLAEWVAIAKTCPESAPRARLRWFKETHGLLQNRASYVLSEAFPPAAGWDDPEALRSALWSDPVQRAIHDAVAAAVMRLPHVVVGQRKTYSAWSNKHQFAALRPIKGGGAMLGLALTLDVAPGLQAPKNESWSERLKSRMPADVAGGCDGRGRGFAVSGLGEADRHQFGWRSSANAKRRSRFGRKAQLSLKGENSDTRYAISASTAGRSCSRYRPTGKRSALSAM